jgi:hypothetical protein
MLHDRGVRCAYVEVSGAMPGRWNRPKETAVKRTKALWARMKISNPGRRLIEPGHRKEPKCL